ncbi:MAG: hypothetical protein H8D67_07675 [Deltaproteobacteria bacterium]|nr:hypothetical protein [Deltaproteobacteria bacterium]
MNNLNKTAFILSFIFPGLGQIWNREFMKGLCFIILQIVSLLLIFYPDSTLFPLGMVVAPILWVWGMVDASRIYAFRYTPGRRKNVRLITIGIMGFWILSEGIFVSVVLKMKNTNEPSAEEVGSRVQSYAIPSEQNSAAPSFYIDVEPTKPVAENPNLG